MNDDYSPADVRLKGEDLERARKLVSQARSSMLQAQGHLAALGTIVSSALDDDSAVSTVEVSHLLADESDGGSVLVCYYDSTGRCIECWEDPPGICRPCSDTKPGPKSPGPVYLAL